MNIKNLKNYDEVLLGNVFKVRNSTHPFLMGYDFDTGMGVDKIVDLYSQCVYDLDDFCEMYLPYNHDVTDEELCNYYGVDVIVDDVMKCLFFD